MQITKYFVRSLLIISLFSSGFGQNTANTNKPDAFEELIRANTFRLENNEGKLSGQGAAVLDSAMKNVQFVAIGENHNKRAVHQFGEALFRLLHEKYNFNYLALEEDPYWGKLLSEASRKSGNEAVLNLALRYPNAFHMYTEDEIKMIEVIGKMSSAPKNSIWGLNQVFGAAHVYERLIEIAPNAEARKTAQRLFDDALQHEKERFQKNTHYLVNIAKPEDFASLRTAFKPKPNSEADWLIGQIALSNQIFAPYAAKPRPTSAVFYESGKIRENNMKHLFAERYKEAQKAGIALPKVMAMFGHLHLYRGLAENTEQYTLGNFLSEFAHFNGTQSVHIYTAVNFEGIEKSFFSPLTNEASKTTGDSAFGAVVDLRPLFDYARKSKDMNPTLRRLIMGYDILLFMRDGETGSLKRLQTPNFRWYPS